MGRGRKQLVYGTPCRRGHPWNRTSDGKRCLSCYPSRPQAAKIAARRTERAAMKQARRQATLDARMVARNARLLRKQAEQQLRFAEKAAQSKERVEAKLELSRAEDEARQTAHAAKLAARALRDERSSANCAEREARAAAKARCRQELLEARQHRKQKHEERLLRLEAERLRRQQLREEREAVWAEKRRARTPAEHKAALKEKRKASARRLDFIVSAKRGLRRHKGPRATVAELRDLWLRQRGCCALTGARIELIKPMLDHKTPVSKGGVHTIDNLQWVHPMANLAKNNYTDAEFQDWLLVAAAALTAKRQLDALL